MKKLYFTEEEKKQAKAEWDRQYRLRKKEQVKQQKQQYYLDNKDKIAEKSKLLYLANAEKVKQRVKLWKENNREKHNANCMERHTKKMQACPSWLSEDDKWFIQEAYHIAKLRSEVTGVKHHVDHIVPLRSKQVCGLHVPWNLQVITASENCSKRNSFNEPRN
jgi:hypothetical protein